MLQPLQLQDVLARYAPEIAELREFFAKAGITVETPETLRRVCGRLREDRAFRRDLTSHLWVILHASGASARPADLLGVLVVAAAGLGLATEAADTEAHELLRFVMEARRSFEGIPGPAREPAAYRSTAPVVLSSAQPRAVVEESVPALFTRGVLPQQTASLSLAMPPETEGSRRVLWIGAAACALVVLLAGWMFHHRSPASPAAVTQSTTARGEAPALPPVPASADEEELHQKPTAGRALSARRALHAAPYSRVAEGPVDLPEAHVAAHAKPSPAIPLTATPRSVAAVRSPARPYARSSRVAPAAKPAVVAGNGASYVPKVVAVDTFNRGGAAASAGTARQAIVRPTSLGIMAANVMYSPAPIYPKAATAEHVQGEVKLEAEVDRDGTVASTRIISGPPLLADAAADAVEHWRYRPYLYEGKPIAMNAQIVMDFQLP